MLHGCNSTTLSVPSAKAILPKQCCVKRCWHNRSENDSAEDGSWGKSCLLQGAVRPVRCFGEPQNQNLFPKAWKVTAKGINIPSDVCGGSNGYSSMCKDQFQEGNSHSTTPPPPSHKEFRQFNRIQLTGLWKDIFSRLTADRGDWLLISYTQKWLRHYKSSLYYTESLQ